MAGKETLTSGQIGGEYPETVEREPVFQESQIQESAERLSEILEGFERSWKRKDRQFPIEELPQGWFEEELKRIEKGLEYSGKGAGRKDEELEKFMKEGVDIDMIDGVGGRSHSLYMRRYSERELIEIIWCTSGPFLEKLAEESLKRLLRERRIKLFLERDVEDW